jgi:hypothetical protein
MNETFRTIVPVPVNPRPIEPGHSILCIGSCFAEAIGERLVDFCFKTALNPFGPLFNPLSITQNLSRLMDSRPFSSDELFEHDGLWQSFSHHGSFSSPDREGCLSKVNDAFNPAAAILKRLDTLIITLGTAYVYVDRETGKVVANCHKLPGARFIRRLASIEEIVESIDAVLGRISSSRPMVNIILTVSPVRHLRDNAHENSVSKAFLMAAVHELENRFPALYYFPSYEIMMDDLRDYRFYADDLTHPNKVAVDYLWKQFMVSCMSERSRMFCDGFSDILDAMRHRLGQPQSPAAKTFLSNMSSHCLELQGNFPEIDLSAVIDHFSSGRH